MNNENRNIHKFVIGKIGCASKSITFKENEFKKELAPINAEIKHFKKDEENYIIMTYKL